MEQTDPPAKVASNDQLGPSDDALPLRLLSAVETVQGVSGSSIQLRGEIVRLLAERARYSALAEALETTDIKVMPKDCQTSTACRRDGCHGACLPAKQERRIGCHECAWGKVAGCWRCGSGA